MKYAIAIAVLVAFAAEAQAQFFNPGQGPIGGGTYVAPPTGYYAAPPMKPTVVPTQRFAPQGKAKKKVRRS
jgi:hypothetical protein